MNKFKIILFLLLVLSTYTFAQSYKTINPDRVAYYSNKWDNIKCIRIDSVKYKPDTILYPFSNMQGIDRYGYCSTPFGDSWIGKQVVLAGNGTNIFFNKNNDSIVIKTDAVLNESWTMFHIADSIKVIATIIKHDTLSVFNQIDSVKTIGIQVYGKNMNPLNYTVNNYKMLLSKNNGLIRIFNYYLFPDIEGSYFDTQIEEYNLIGLSNPDVGVQNLKWFEANDFQAGDELHVKETSSAWGTGYNYEHTQRNIYTYLGRTDYPDSIVYTCYNKQSNYDLWNDSSTIKYSSDTARIVINADKLFDRMLPGEPVINQQEAFFYTMTNGVNVSKTIPSEALMYRNQDNTCWSNCCYDGCFPSYTYVKGLGGPYYQCYDGIFPGSFNRELVYYKKGQNTWGTPMIIDNISDKHINETIKVFPNPANEYITVQISEIYPNMLLEIVDINGRIIVTKTLKSKINRIETASLKSGIYLYRLYINNKVIKTDKLIIN